MRVLLTGVSGFLGSHVAECLIGSGHEVLGIVRDPARLDPDLAPWRMPVPGGRPPLTLIRCGLEEPALLAQAAAESDAVIHVAGLIQASTERAYMRVNRDGTETLMRAIAPHAARIRRFILVSSQAAGGPAREGRAVSGDDPPRPVSAYGRSKLAGEVAALAFKDRFPVTVLRPPVIFGPRDRMLAGMFRWIGRGRGIVWGDGSHAFNVVHAPDVARAALLALERPHPSGAILYTSDERTFTWRSFMGLLAEVLGVRDRLIGIPPPLFVAAAGISNSLAWLTRTTPVFSWDKIHELKQKAWLCTSGATRDQLGWSPASSVEQALVTTYAWYRSRGIL